jgi:hypothetical protein
MKNKLISSILIIFYSYYSGSAQSNFQPEASIGIKAGVNFSEISTDTLLDQKLQPGYNGGIVFTFISQPHMGIQLEFNYTQKGWTEIIDTSDSYKRKINYFELPLLTRIETGVRSTRVYFVLGPYFSVEINESSAFNVKKEIKPYFKNKTDNNLDGGLCGGIGFMQKTKIGIFEIEFRYSNDIGNIFKPDHYSTFSTSKNQVFSFDLMYLIDL